MTAGLLLHLSGPLQSWGIRSTWAEKDTHHYPTRSGLLGMLAAALGHDRNRPLKGRFDSLRMLIRIDRPGQRLIDYHTVGGGCERDQTPPRAAGGRRPAGQGTIVSNRHYLSDAAFTVAVTTNEHPLLDELAEALRHPHWDVHLGRRSCPPASPLVLGRHRDPRTALLRQIPLHRPIPRNVDTTVAVDFVDDTAPADHDGRIDSLTDEPISYHPDERSFGSRSTYVSTEHLPARLCGGHGPDYLDALGTALKGVAQ